MRLSRQVVLPIVGALTLAAGSLWADTGDVESSHDYKGIPRLPGFLISDYDEDAPASFDFPVSRPTALDSNHIEKIHVKGHRYAIRYELAPGSATITLYDTQKYYEKLAADAGFTAQKTGATGDSTETFYRALGAGSVWFYVEPSITANVVTIVESNVGIAPPLTAPPPAPRSLDLADQPATLPSGDLPAMPATLPDSAPPALPTEQSHDALYASLSDDGRVVVPFVFRPGKDDLDDASKPLVDRVVAMMKKHSDLFLRIEGHTDNSGDSDTNMRLSAQRAMAIEAQLVSADIDKKRLDAVGVGGLQPLADNSTAEGREKNRRIELVMWKKGPAFHQPEETETASTQKAADVDPTLNLDLPGQKSTFHHVASTDTDVDDDTPPADAPAPRVTNAPAFHAAAPNGNNYYPTASNGTSTAKNAF